MRNIWCLTYPFSCSCRSTLSRKESESALDFVHLLDPSVAITERNGLGPNATTTRNDLLCRWPMNFIPPNLQSLRLVSWPTCPMEQACRQGKYLLGTSPHCLNAQGRDSPKPLALVQYTCRDNPDLKSIFDRGMYLGSMTLREAGRYFTDLMESPDKVFRHIFSLRVQ